MINKLEYLKPFKNIVNYNDKFWNRELIKDLKELDRITERFERGIKYER